jgi:hypothetical protein
MPVPAIIAGVAAVAAIAGTAVSTYSAVRAAKAQAQAADIEAASARESAAYNARQWQAEASRKMSRARAVAAATGVDPGTGSPLLMDLENARQAEMERLNIIRTGEVSAIGKEFESRLASATIPWTIAGGALRTVGQGAAGYGSVLSAWNKR